MAERIAAAERADRLVAWLTERLATSGARGFVFGLSGGIDSAVVSRLCQLAAPEHVLGVLLPCHSDPQDERDARLVAEAFGIPVARVDLGATFDTLTDTVERAVDGLGHAAGVIDIRQQMPRANVKPRLRMTTLYLVANALNYLVVGTGNRSEITIGYYTKYGDGGVDLLPIGGLVKSEVRAVAQALGVPQAILDKAPSAGLWLGQTDESEMGFTYAMLEQYLENPTSVAPDVARRIERLRAASDHKRAMPPVG
ncbi:MAG: NAD(+) synthase [Vicinamibacterales bacterium]